MAEREKHGSIVTVVIPRASGCGRHEVQQCEVPRRRGLSHHPHIKTPWVDGKKPDLSDTGRVSDATSGPRPTPG